MDKVHAKFILQSYRPDGADASNPDFAEALQVAAEDRELGMWLAHERAHDSMFAEALCSVDIPDDLRDEIFAIMDEESRGEELTSELDAWFIGALAQITPPAGLRDQILSAMEVEHDSTKVTDPKDNKIVSFPMRWLNIAAIAAVLVLSAIFFFPGIQDGKIEQVNLEQVQVGSGNILNASHQVEVSETTLTGVNSWFAKEGMPEAATIPKGLISTDVKGGRKLLLDNGVKASLIYFEKKNAGEFYLMILDVSSIEDAEKLVNISQVCLKTCWNCPVNSYSVTAWKDEHKAYLLLSKVEGKVMAELF